MALDLLVLDNVNVIKNIDEMKEVNINSCDILFDEKGQLMMTEGKIKTFQNVIKIFLNNAIHPEEPLFESPFEISVGNKINYVLAYNILSNVVESLNKYNEYNFDNDNPSEYLAFIERMEILETNDPRFKTFIVDIKLENNESLNVILGIQL